MQKLHDYNFKFLPLNMQRNYVSGFFIVKILHFSESLKGGPASYLNEILPSQIERWGTDRIGLVCPQSDLQFLDIKARTLKQFSAERPRRDASGLMALTAALVRATLEFRPDLVHLHSTYAGLIGRAVLFALPHRPRVVYCAHGWAFDRQSSNKFSRQLVVAAERGLARTTDVIVNISDTDARSASRNRVRARSNATIRNAIAPMPMPSNQDRIEAGRRLGIDPTKINLLFVGRRDLQKGVHIAELAAGMLPVEQFSMVSIGASVVSKQDNFAAPDNVTRLGWVERTKVFDYLIASDALIMPSLWEGFGLTAIEAMRAGIAVISSTAGALPEIIQNGITGYCVDSRDAGAYRDVLLRTSKASLREMGLAGRARFEACFSSTRMISEIEAVYLDLCGEKQVRQLITT